MANAQAKLTAGSYHLMLIDLKQTLKEGETVSITLTFDDGSAKTIEVPVTKLQAMMEMDKYVINILVGQFAKLIFKSFVLNKNPVFRFRVAAYFQNTHQIIL